MELKLQSSWLKNTDAERRGNLERKIVLFLYTVTKRGLHTTHTWYIYTTLSLQRIK